MGLLVVSIVWFVMRFVNRMIAKAMGPKAAATAAPTDFKPEDTVQFVPALKGPTTVTSDRTIDAVLRGTFGPAVVMFYADWCTHCKNMMEAFEAAAAVAGVPFVKIQGHQAPITSQQFGVTGYPTLFGVMAAGGVPRRFAAMRTKEALLEFAGALGLPGTLNPVVPVAPVAPSVASAVASAVGPTMGPVVAAVAPPLEPPETLVVEALPPTVRIT